MMFRQLLLSSLLLGMVAAGTLQAWNGGRMIEAPYPGTPPPAADTIPPLEDRYEDFLTSPRNPFDLNDPSAVEQDVEYDPATGNYIITERIGETLFRPPTFLTFDEYMELKRRRDQAEYFNQLGGYGRDRNLSLEDPLAAVDVESSLLDRLFGGNEVNIQPQGSIDLTFGFDYQYLENPILTLRQRRNGGFDFDMAIQMNVTGQIGEKLKLTTNYNTQATFNFDNQIKLDYNSDAFSEDDILKKIEAGNVSLPLRGTLIQGAQSLFGLKTELQFGHLRITAIASQQQSQNETITLQGGSQIQEFEVKADEYDENRHFFLSHYNRATYEQNLANLPQINTLFHLENIEVWITNDRNEVVDTRDIVALADLGEPQVLTSPDEIPTFQTPRYQEICDGRPLPDNEANGLYQKIISNPEMRDIDRAVAILQSPQFGLQQARDFEKVRARKLSPREYTVHPELGFISINTPVQPDQVLAVSFRYKYNGDVYRVGELATNTDDVSTDTTEQTSQVLFTKMLKSTTQRIDVPAWDLMMKNVYSIGAYQVNPEDFRLDVFYEDPGRGVKRFLPRGDLTGKPLIRVFNLDNLNVQGDPQPDGVFDFVPGVTINPTNGRIIFPVLEPFGDHLAEQISDPTLRDTFVYEELYDLTLFQAQEFPEKNRYVIKGSYKSSVASEISLGAFNIPPGSVRVTAGGQVLRENVDFEVDYSTGRLRILNDAILSSGVPINVTFEDNTVFGLQNKTMLGLRADYELGDNMNIGATFLQLFERPFTPKVNIGDDPINNRIYGLDFNMNQEAPFLTRLVDKLPFYSTTAPSSIAVMAEAAVIDPGHARAINQSRSDKAGIVYIDDFEGSASSIDLRQPTNQWYLASVPQNDEADNNPLFPEARREGLVSGVNRALLNWYRIDPQARGGEDQGDTYTSLVPQEEVFPNRNRQPDQLPNVQTLDLAFYPQDRGPYNFDTPSGYPGVSQGIDLESTDTLGPVKLRGPETRWGGIMRALTVNDFQTANIEFVEFWMLSPFHDDQDPDVADPDAEQKQGTLYLNLGNISEDILKDSRRFFENGLPGPANPNRPVDTTVWARVPVGQQITQAFDNDPDTRRLQDVGLDGFNDGGEADQYQPYLQALQAINPQAAGIVANDPANDNFVFYADTRFNSSQGVRTRYRRFNNPQSNSGSNETNNQRQSGTNRPDAEDLDNDNTLNETESYFQYEIPLRVDPFDRRRVDRSQTPFITDERVDQTTGRIWYRFRVPLNGPERTSVGGIRDFRSIRFMRLYMRGFERPTILRFASLELVRNQWRRYTRNLAQPGQSEAICDGEETDFQVDAVNIEENSSKEPFNYTLPVGIQREQSLGVFQTLQNEQSLALRIDELCDGDSRAVFKYTENDLRVYERLQMFVHAEARDSTSFGEVPDDALRLFVRLGSDFQNNYYEYEIPLKISRPELVAGLNGNLEAYKREVWRQENFLDFPLTILRDLKQARNDLNFDAAEEYGSVYIPEGSTAEHNIKVRGNPNLGFVKVMMVGVRNPRREEDFGANYGVEVWLNELRLTGLDERGGLAALGRVDVQLADLGTMTVSGNYSSIGFGALDQGVQERAREQVTGYDLATNLDLGKFLPTDWGVRLPFYAQYSNTTATPEFDPYDLDIRLKDKLAAEENAEVRDSLREQAQEIVNITTYNLTNVRKERTGNSGDPRPWDIENFSVSYGYTETDRSDPLIEEDNRREYTGGLDYSFSRSVNYVEPFSGIQSKYLRLLSEFNFNPLPNSFTFSTVLDRQFARTRYRFAGVDERFNTFFNKRFLWTRNYDLTWDFTKSLKFSFNATNNSVIDEPDEIAMLENPNITDIRRFRRDSIWKNIQNLGRPKLYEHNINLTYTLPIRYLPYMDWVQVRAQYQGGYRWNAAALNVDSLGNVISNNQNRQLTADLNFEKLYNEFEFLKRVNQPSRNRSSRGRSQPGDDRAQPSRGPQRNSSQQQEASPLARALIRPLLLVRKARITYSEQLGTTVPGFMPDPHLLGLSRGFNAPGWDFVAGLQPKIRNLNENWYGSDDWLFQNREWITDKVWLNQDVIQTYTQTFDGRITLEPFQDFRIEVEANRSYSENYTETFKVLEKDSSDYQHAVPTYGGQLTVSYNALNTLFQSSNDEIIALFNTMQSYRPIISQRLGSGLHEDPELAQQGYTEGYGRNQQDVLIPAFIAAYTGQDPNSIDLNVFDTPWKPNWRLSYNGLSRLPGLRDLFSSFNISHGYRSTFTINSYRTSLDYLASLRQTADVGKDSVSFNFYPRIEIPDVVIQENFAPLFALEMQTQSGISFNFDYKQSRALALSVTSKLLSETRTKEIVAGFGYVMQGVNIPFLTGNRNDRRGRGDDDDDQGANRGRSGRSGGRLQGQDMDIQFNFSFRDDITVAQKLDQNLFEPTRGSLAISLSPSVEYQISRSLSLRAFVDYRRTVPKNSAGFPRTDASGGIVVRFQLN